MVDKKFEKLNEFIKDLDLSVYWPGFEAVAFAFYNDERVRLYNHPICKRNNKTYVELPRSDAFLGETVILYENYPTAIVYTNFHKDAANMYAVLVHELFHGYQYILEESRFANELDGITYPISPVNIQLRNEERAALHRALLSSTKEERDEHINNFISLRDERSKIIGKYLEYEKRIETIEGPAYYVELKAYQAKTSLPFKRAIKKFSSQLINKTEANLELRKSCYSSGLFLCLLLDKVHAHWHDAFMKSDQTLYDFFKSKVHYGTVNKSDIHIDNETEHIVNLIHATKEQEMEQFYTQSGNLITIKGDIKTTLIDPMNLVQHHHQALHKNFVKIGVNKREYLLKQRVMVHFNKHDKKKIDKIELFSDENPIELNRYVKIRGIGEFEGTFDKKPHTIVV